MDNKVGVFGIKCIAKHRMFISYSSNVGSRVRGLRKNLRDGKYRGISGNLGELQQDWDTMGEDFFKWELLKECSRDDCVLEQAKVIKDCAESGYSFYNHIYHGAVMEIPENREKIVKKLLLMVDTYGEGDVSEGLDRMMDFFATRPGGSRG